MLEDKLKDCQKAIEAKKSEVQEKWSHFDEKRKALAEAKDIDLTNPEDERAKALVDEADEAMKPYSKASEELRTLEGQFERLAMMAADGGEKTVNINAENDIDRNELEARESLGQKAISSDAYKRFKDMGAFEDGSKLQLQGPISDPMDMEHFKSLLTGRTGAAGGVMNVPQRFPGVVDLPQLPLGVFDLITVGETGERSVEFVRLLTRTIRAAEVAEAETAADIAVGPPEVTAVQAGQKPESDLTFEIVQEAVKAIAHWIPGTRAQLADAPFLRTLIDNELLDGVERRGQIQVMQGDGAGENIRGIYNTPGIANYTIGSAPGAAGEPVADAIHRTFTLLRLAGFEPTGELIHPNDWQNVRLSKDNNGQYQFGPPSLSGQSQIWGVPAVQSIAAREGEPVAGEWRRALFLVREAAKVLVSDSHKDWFTRNLIAILAEGRGVLVVPRPQAFGRTDLTP